MITANLTGNLGNHLWNYAVCRIVAETKGFEWGIDPSPIYDYYNGKSQLYFMDLDYGKKVVFSQKNQRGLNMYQGITNEYYDVPKHWRDCNINFYDPNVFNISDNTMIHLISQSEKYLLDYPSCQEWFNIKDEYVTQYTQACIDNNIVLDDNLCVINFRGGEYCSVANLIAAPKYWQDSINHMLRLNPNMKFIIITDDKNVATRFIGDYPCYHFDIGMDFFIVNRAKYLIISNSSFGWWAAWLNRNTRLTIAPKYWARHNTSDGFWALGDQYTTKFHYMSREGVLQDYETCKSEAIQYYKINNISNYEQGL